MVLSFYIFKIVWTPLSIQCLICHNYLHTNAPQKNKTALFCFVVAIILLIFGTFMEGTAIAVILVPILWPIAQSMGIDVIHFGMIVCISNVVGTMTPPVAVNIFSASTVSGLKMGDIAKAEIPFLIGYVAVFFCCVFSETFCTFLI